MIPNIFWNIDKRRIYCSVKQAGYKLKKNRYLNIVFAPFAVAFYCFNCLPSKRSDRILIANMGGIGDILMMSPMAVELSKMFKVDLIVQSPDIKEIFKGQDYFSKIFIIQNYKIDRFSNPQRQVRSTLLLLLFYPLEFMRFSLKRYRIGLNCAHFPWNSKFTNVLLKALNIPERYGFSDDTGLYLHGCVNTKGLYGSDLYLSLLKIINDKSNISSELYYYVSDEWTQKVFTDIVSPHMNEGIKKFAVLHPGGKIHINSRRWPKEYFVELGKFLVSKGFAVFVSGQGQGDEEVCQYVTDDIGLNSINLCNKISFSEFAAILKLADICITNDTSTIHIANAVKCKKIVSIFGPTSSEFLVAKNERNIVIRSKLECSPCRQAVIHEDVEPCLRTVKVECLRSIAPERVIHEIVPLIENHLE